MESMRTHGLARTTAYANLLRVVREINDCSQLKLNVQTIVVCWNNEHISLKAEAAIDYFNMVYWSNRRNRNKNKSTTM